MRCVFVNVCVVCRWTGTAVALFLGDTPTGGQMPHDCSDLPEGVFTGASIQWHRCSTSGSRVQVVFYTTAVCHCGWEEMVPFRVKGCWFLTGCWQGWDCYFWEWEWNKHIIKSAKYVQDIDLVSLLREKSFPGPFEGPCPVAGPSLHLLFFKPGSVVAATGQSM